MKKILFLLFVCIICFLPINTLAHDRFDRSQNKQEYGDRARDRYREEQQHREEMNQRLEEQRRELNRLQRQQDELRNQMESDRFRK